MLKRWTVKNFKSIGKQVELDTPLLTIIAGANSSGKSTLLQSILIAKQTIENSSERRPLTLNGPILKLGRFDDVKHTSAQNEHMGFGCEFKFDRSPEKGSPQSSGLRLIHTRDVEARYTDISFRAEFDADAHDDVSQIQPRLKYAELTARGALAKTELTERLSDVELKKSTFSSVAIGISDNGSVSNLAALQRDLTRSQVADGFNHPSIDQETTDELLEDYPDGRVIGVQTSFFLPSHAQIEYDGNISKAAIIADALCNARVPIRSRHRISPDEKIPTSALKLVLNYLAKSNLTQPGIPGLFPRFEEQDDVIEFVDALGIMRQAVGAPAHTNDSQRLFPGTRAARAALQEIQPILAGTIKRTLGIDTRTAMVQTGSMSDAEDYITSFFRSRVRYLGPLRDEPRPLYQLEALSDPRNVGYRGEHTAAVFELNKDREVAFIPPPQNGRSQAAIRQSLHDATVMWLNYLGVASELSTSDRGKFGHEMQVSTGVSTKLHDLTNVGVGVSQVLPIVVMSLLLPATSTLIFEQPELHLHPRVQSRLADFFLSLTREGKQCIIETHSEYMVRRVRLRIAEAEGTSLNELVKIYFVSLENGVSKFIDVQVSEYGSIKNWPVDFFDQGDRELQELLEASMKKRAMKSRSGLEY